MWKLVEQEYLRLFLPKFKIIPTYKHRKQKNDEKLPVLCYIHCWNLYMYVE